MEPLEAARQARIFYRVAAALLALLALTVALNYVDLGRFNFAAALSIAAVKAALVAYFFMELNEGVDAVWFLAVGSLIWFGLLLSGTLADLVTRTPAR